MTLPSPHADPRAFLRALFDAAVAQALPGPSLAHYLPAPPRGRTIVLGAGKAGGAMAAALDAAWPSGAPISGLVVTRYDYVPPAFAAAQQRGATRIEVVQAAHPVPDEAGRRAAARVLDLARGLSDDLVVCLVSGRASSLLALPAAGVALAEKQVINGALLKSGAAIDEMNCVRKHLSAIKGGRLGAACAPARVVTLLVSDVPGDSPSVIGSGPTGRIARGRQGARGAGAPGGPPQSAVRDAMRRAVRWRDDGDGQAPGRPRRPGQRVRPRLRDRPAVRRTSGCSLPTPTASTASRATPGRS